MLYIDIRKRKFWKRFQDTENCYVGNMNEVHTKYAVKIIFFKPCTQKAPRVRDSYILVTHNKLLLLKKTMKGNIRQKAERIARHVS
jgi:hypothetical protein